MTVNKRTRYYIIHHTNNVIHDSNYIIAGTSTQDILCRGSHFIQNAMKMSGVAGIPTLIMIFFLMACSKKGREKIVAKLKVFATFLLFTCAIFYWAGNFSL